MQGKGYGNGTTHAAVVQPYLGAKFDLGRGFKLSGLLRQRWRDGTVDFAGFMDDRNIAPEHEDYGAVRVGAMKARAWRMADQPFGTAIGLADAWASSGAGDGLLTRAIRVTSRPFDVAEGDLVVTDDNDAFRASAPTRITDQIDFVALHSRVNGDSWFDPTRRAWKSKDVPARQRAVAMMDAALVEAKRQYQEARGHLDRKGLSCLPIIIGETGWNAVDLGRQKFRAHPVNQKLALDRLRAWAAEGRTGRPNGAAITMPIVVDAIRWTK